MNKEKNDRRRGGRGRDRYDDRRRGGYNDDRYYKKSSKNLDKRDKYSSKHSSRYGGLDRYDEEEYTKKSDSKKLERNTTSIKELPESKPVEEEKPKKDVMTVAREEIKTFFKSCSKDQTFDPYPDFFNKKNENLSELTYAQLMELWF